MNSDVWVRDMHGLRQETIMDIDYSTFQYEYEQNTSRNLQFTVQKTDYNAFSFDLLTTESFIIYKGQEYVVKSCTHGMTGYTRTKEIVAHHIGFTCVDFVQRNVQVGVKTYSIDEMLAHGFQGNKGGFTYKIHGTFARQKIENLGGMTLMDYLQKAADAFGAYILADNKTWHIYSEEEFFQPSDYVLRYLYNTDSVKVEEHTDNLKTVVKAFGKPKETTKEVLTDNDYYAVGVYKSREVERYGEREALAVSDERFTNQNELLKWAATQIIDRPEISLEMTYYDTEVLNERSKIWFIHEELGYNLWVKLTRFIDYHKLAQKPPELGFMSRPRDMLGIQQKLQRSVQESQKKLSDSQYTLNNIQTTTNDLYNDRIIAEVMNQNVLLKQMSSSNELQVQLKNQNGDVLFPNVRIEDIETATNQNNGLMLASDKAKVDSIETGAQVNNVSEEEKVFWNRKQDAFLIAPSGTKYKLVVSDDGQISTTLYE